MLRKRLTQGHDLGTVLNVAFQVFQKQRKVIILTALIIRLVVVLVGNYLLVYLPGVANLFATNPFGTQPNPIEMMQFLQHARSAAPSLGLLGVIVVLSGMLLQIGIVRLTVATIDAKTISRKTIVSDGISRIFPLIGTHIIMGFFLLILFALLIVPGIVFSIYRIFASTLTILVGVRGRDTLRHSKQLVKGRRRQTARVAFGSGVLIGITKEIIGAILTFITQGYLTHAQIGSLNMLIQLIFILIGFIVTTVFFYRRKLTAPLAQDQIQRKQL